MVGDSWYFLILFDAGEIVPLRICFVCEVAFIYGGALITIMDGGEALE